MDCEHERTELRVKTFTNGSQHIAIQCLTCGQQRSTYRKHDDLSAESFANLQAWDEELSEFWYARQRDVVSNARKKQHYDRKYAYEAWLRTPEWKWIRRKVLQRDINLCQCCLEETATQVHHEEYAGEIRDTPLWALHSICETCHKRLHGQEVDDGR